MFGHNKVGPHNVQLFVVATDCWLGTLVDKWRDGSLALLMIIINSKFILI